MKNLIFIALLLSCTSTLNNVKEYEILFKSDVTYGKCGINYDEITFLSKKFNLNKKFISSSLYFKNNDNTNYVINDKTFNYSFFDSNDKIIEREVKIFAKSYVYKDKSNYLVFRIE